MALGEVFAKIFAKSDRDVLKNVMGNADHMSPAEIQGHVDAANRAGKVDLAFLLGSLKYAKEAWDNMAFWTRRAPNTKVGEVLLDRKSLPGNWQVYDKFGSPDAATKAALKRPDGMISQQELMRGIVNDRAIQLGIKKLQFPSVTPKI